MEKTKKDYENDREKMTDKEKEEDSSKRMDAYKALCLGGLTSMYWKDTTMLISKVHALNGIFAGFLSVFFAVSQGGMLIGLAASSFPKSSPWSEIVASNGSLLAVLCNIAAFHLEIVDFLDPISLLVSWIVISVAFGFYWYICSQDIMILKILYKLLYPILKPLWFLIKTLLWYFFWYFVFYPFYLLFGRASFGALDSVTILTFGTDISGVLQSAATKQLGVGTRRSAAVTEESVGLADGNPSEEEEEGMRHRSTAHTPDDMV